MKRLSFLVALLTVLFCSTVSHAVTPFGAGIFVVSDCLTISNPESGNTWCLVANPVPNISVWNGSSYAAVPTTAFSLTSPGDANGQKIINLQQASNPNDAIGWGQNAQFNNVV